MYCYTVRCEFTGENPDTPDRWLAWLKDLHIADVMTGGAIVAEIVKMSAQEHPTFEIRYQFDSAEDFKRYERDFAPDLRKEGIRLFPPEQLGLKYSRTDGPVIFAASAS